MTRNKSRGALIVLTGIDGSGKTLQAERLVERLSGAGCDVAYTWARWRPILMKPLVRLSGRRSEAHGTTADDGREGLRHFVLANPVLRMLWLNLAAFDYWLITGRLVRRLSRDHQVVVADRYVADFVVDQAAHLHRGAGGIGQVSRALALRLFVRPDLIVVLDLDPELAALRKGDGTDVRYLAERRALYLGLEGEFATEAVNAAAPPEHVSCDIAAACRRVLGGYFA